MLIALRADVNTVDPSGATPLHMAAGVGLGWAAAALLTAGALRNKPNDRGQFPLDYVGLSPTGARTNKWVYERLLGAGCQPNPEWDKMPGRGKGGCVYERT